MSAPEDNSIVTPAAAPDPPSDAYSAIYWIGVIRSRLKLLVAIWISTIALVLVYLFYAQPIYSSSATILLQSQRGSIFTREANGGVPLDVGEIETQIEIAKSESVAKEVASHVNLEKMYKTLQTNQRNSILAFLLPNVGAGPSANSSRPTQELASHEMLEHLMAGLRVTRPGLSFTLNFTYSSPDPILSSELTNAFADAYIAVQQKAKYDVLRRANSWIEERSNELRQRADTAAKAVDSFRSNGGGAISADMLSNSGSGSESSRIRLERLESTAKILQESYESFIRRSSETTQQLTAPGPDAAIINSAFPALSPTSPRKKLILAASLIGGFLLGAICAIVCQLYFDIKSKLTTSNGD